MFQQIIYINLKHRKDRLENVLKQILKIDKKNNAIKINAIDGRTLDVNNISQLLITQNGMDDAINNNLSVGIPLTRGAIGCALSHREAYIKIINDKINVALIVEDDITIDENKYKKVIDEIYINKPDDYDIIYLGYHDATIKYIYEKINDIIYRSNIVYGLFGYIVTNKGAKKLLNIFPISRQIDTEISIHFDKINSYIVHPEKRIIFSDESDKNIKFGTDIQIRETLSPHNQHVDYEGIILSQKQMALKKPPVFSETYKNNKKINIFDINIIDWIKKKIKLLKCIILCYRILIILIIICFYLYIIQNL